MQQLHQESPQQVRVQEWMRKSPLRITRARVSVAEVLLREKAPISAELVFRRLIDIGEDVSLGSVYRILKQMGDDGLVLRDRHVSAGGIKSVYSIARATTLSRTCLFRCDVCHRQQRVADTALAAQLANVGALENFALPSEIVILARCSTCTPSTYPADSRALTPANNAN